MHSIRLHGPWECQPVERWSPAGAELAPVPVGSTKTVRIPADWEEPLGKGFRGRVRFRRRFGCPRNLAADQRVWLMLDQVQGTAVVMLGGVRLGSLRGPDFPARFDVTSLLKPRNELVVEITQLVEAPLPGGITGEVRLEIAD